MLCNSSILFCFNVGYIPSSVNQVLSETPLGKCR